MKTGTSMVITTRSKQHYENMRKKNSQLNSQKKKRAKICIGCENNKEGFCFKHKSWCYSVNSSCSGVKKSV
ncbi:hypothetical protein [Clostridium estertheticum]|uniref:hypothetical protein n=1 Tax=Clostridium estertheticum TaxID=238834 RepID=UPI001CF16599|nr:hypothetical protein [Clostridium estertheticum]MCB2361977.1 hypothetical protein [Clostridium estertheticum]